MQNCIASRFKGIRLKGVPGANFVPALCPNFKNYKSREDTMNQETLIYQYLKVHQEPRKTGSSKLQNRM
jgi:hypothetical protein